MATPKKKHLIELMIEADVKWPDGAEYAAQDKDEWLAFYTRKPYREDGKVTWSSNGCYVANSMKKLDLLCRNWHQTIVTREQYAEAVAAAAYCLHVTMVGCQLRQRRVSRRPPTT